MFIPLFISHHFTCSHPSHSLKNPASVTAAVPVGGEPMRVLIASCTAGSSWCKLHSVVCYTRSQILTKLQYPVRKNVELWWICELCRLKSRSSPHRHHKANPGVFWDLCTLACFHMLSVQLEINSLSSYSASTLLNSTADLQVCYKCWNVLKLLMRSCFSQIWPSYQLGTVNRRFSNSIRLWFHTTAIAKISAETKRTGTNQDVKHCETFPKSKEKKASYVAKECEREISVCKKV